MSVLGGNILRSTIQLDPTSGWTGYWNQILYGRIPMDIAFRVQYPIIHFRIKIPSFSGTKCVFAFNNPNFYVEYLSGGVLRLGHKRIGDVGVTLVGFPSGTFTNGVTYDVTFKLRPNDRSWDLYKDGVLIVNLSSGYQIAYGTNANIEFGQRYATYKAKMNIYKFIVCADSTQNLDLIFNGYTPPASVIKLQPIPSKTGLVWANEAPAAPGSTDLDWFLAGSPADTQWVFI